MVKTRKDDESQDTSCSEEASVSKSKPKSQGKKRKRSSSESSNDNEIILADNALETERNVHTSALKNNLDETSVRKIIKRVVTNDHVLAFVKLQEEEENSSVDDKNLQPKLTRAKVKELNKVSASKSSAWHLDKLELTPIKHIPVKTRPEVKALIAQELPDDEDDEEYEPTHDDVPSDDDHVESCSDLDSQPRTPATPAAAESPRVVKDGPFKVPQDVLTSRRKLDLEEEEATIALRTRSKLSLSATSIEHIESTFVPPDDIPHPDVDDLWSEFLNECMNPEPAARNEDDDEADPEYNVASDPDAHDEDEETLSNSIIKISKKELNDLVTELFSILPGTDEGTEVSVVANTSQNSVTSQQWEGKQEAPSEDEDEHSENPSKKLEFETERSDVRPKDKDKNTLPHERGKEMRDTQVTDQSEKENVSVQNQNVTVQNGGVIKQNGSVIVQNQNVNTQNRFVAIAPKIQPSNSRPRLQISTKNRNIEISVVQEPQDTPPAEVVREPARQITPTPQLVHVHVQSDVTEEPRKPSPEAGREAPAALRVHMASAPPELVHIHVQADVTVSPEQLTILQQQLRQHVQLAASNFMQTVVHPVHWKLAPKYKEYLESLVKMTEEKESVVNVCNLKPAYELITIWEKSVSEDTEENREMIQFLQKEVERSRRRINNNKLYGGQFHETFKKVVANSTVFLYPSLLPSMPFRPDNTRRFYYQPSEETLIVLGLDQFWRYVESNPDIYRLYRNPVPNARRGYMATVQLVCKHMLPWIAPNRLVAHINTVRNAKDNENPIYRYFKYNELPEIKHVIVPYNPQLTLYEQPEHEVPRLWVQYLAKTSKRFRSYLYRRATPAHRLPTGTQIISGTPQDTLKKPLPIDFTKEIISSRASLYKKTPKPNLTDKVDIQIEPLNQTQNQITLDSNQITINSTNDPNLMTAKSFYKLVETSTGAFLVPFQVETQTVDTRTGPIMTPAEISTIVANNIPENVPKKVICSTEHCMCCMLLKKISKERQTLITEHFSKNKAKCVCNSKTYPRISNRLKLLIKHHKKKSELVFKELEMRLKGEKTECSDTDGLDSKDLAHVLQYQLKLFTRASMSKRIFVKKRVNSLLCKFDLDTGDPIKLAKDMFKVFDVELVDLYIDFLGFLTPAQADKLTVFKDYFVRNCAQELMEKIEEQVKDKASRLKILSQLNQTLISNGAACELCAGLLATMTGHPALARACFHMFPHRKENRAQMYTVQPAVPIQPQITNGPQPTVADVDEPSAVGDDQPDDSSGEEESDAISADGETTLVPSAPEQANEANEATDRPIKTELSAEPGMSMDTEGPDSDTSISDYEDGDLKIEETADWTKHEDRIILQVLQEHLTREERKGSFQNDKSIIDLLEEKNVYTMLYECLTDRSLTQVKERVLYLLTMLVISERNA